MGPANNPTEDVCSEGSEVDWSWLEEVEYLRATESLVAAGERGEQVGRVSATPTNGSAGRRRGCENRETARSVAMSVTATAKSLVGGGSRWPPSGGALLLDRQNNNNNNRRSGGRHRRQRNDSDNNNDGDEDEDEAAAAHCNATNEAVDRENRDGTTATTVTAAASSVAATANSWMRASMRRLRHLRLPDGAQRTVEPASRRAVVVSAPNSLPDIALIAPEILAAQTNGTGTSGTLLRPSSAPARNAGAGAGAGAGAAAAATPRRPGRQFATGRSRGARNREVSSRQGSLASRTTASDTTVSGNTTCSSSFGGASSSAPSSTATSPQRAPTRRSVREFSHCASYALADVFAEDGSFALLQTSNSYPETLSFTFREKKEI